MRARRDIIVRLVEPNELKPDKHGGLFEAVITQLCFPQPEAADLARRPLLGGVEFDLLTFPEAFAPAESFLNVLRGIAALDDCGLVHVGLRLDGGDAHLFDVPTLQKLVGDILAIAPAAERDLGPFRAWLSEEAKAHLRYNIAALFMVDAAGDLRVCLHPKVVRSRFEESAFARYDMAEGNLLTLVTLLSTDTLQKSLTVQPLICSDALDLLTDSKLPPPIAAIDSVASPFDDPPDHVDLVSVATATPQAFRKGSGTTRVRVWQQMFRNAFCGAADGGTGGRHHFSTFVLANYEIVEGKPGGLSGLFQPADPRETRQHDLLQYSYLGRQKDDSETIWTVPGTEPENFERRAYLASLTPSEGKGVVVRILGFRLPASLRDHPPWKRLSGPNSCEVLVGGLDEHGQLRFTNWSEIDDDRP